MSTTEIFESTMGRIEIDREARIVRLTRSAEPIDPAALDAVVDDMTRIVPLRERPRLVLLQDMRLAPLIRNDAVELALADAGPRLSAGFAARAVLLASAVGVLQAGRMVRRVGGEARTFTDESEAVRYLQGEVARLRLV